MRDLNYDLKQLCRHNRDGSYATQADREHILDLIADQLHEMGFRHMNAHSLKPKHVEKLVERWLAEELSPGTIKNRMSAFAGGPRRSARRTSSPAPMPPTASRIGCTSPTSAKQRNSIWTSSSKFRISSFTCRSACRRCLACAGRSRSRSSRRGPIAAIDWCSRIPGPRAGGSARFPSAPRSSGNSSTRRRRWPRARVWSRRATRTYRDYLKYFRYQCERVGIHAFHGHRHFYAQTRYQELTGWACPARGGTKSKQLTPKQKEIDRQARETISREMGHGREQITAVYLGR